jgi:hypothetical protein
MVETISIPLRTPMLAAGQIDAALGYSFRLYVMSISTIVACRGTISC